MELRELLGGQIAALGVSTLERNPLAPDVPTIAESGFPGFQATSDFARTSDFMRRMVSASSMTMTSPAYPAPRTMARMPRR